MEANTKTQSLRSILDHFSDSRNVYVDPVAKQRARDFIVNMFNDHGLLTWTERFPSNQEKVNKIKNSLHKGKLIEHSKWKVGIFIFVVQDELCLLHESVVPNTYISIGQP